MVDSKSSLVSLCHGSIKVTCEYLNIKLNSIRSSALDINYPKSIQAGQWAPYIANHMKCSGYLNPIGGASLFQKSEFDRFGLDLKFLECKDFSYTQVGITFAKTYQ